MAWNFTERVQEAVEEKGWSHKVLAERSGIPAYQVGRIMRGETTRPSPEVVRKLAKTLEVTTDYLLGMDDLETEREAAVAR